MEKAGITLLQYGALGAIVIGMAFYIIYLHKERRKEKVYERDERKEQTGIIQKQFERMHEMADNQSQITKDNTNVLAALKTLLEIDIKMKN